MTVGGGGGGSSTIPVAPKSSIVFLHQWWLVNKRNGLAVGGVAFDERGRERMFLSNVIAEREEANVLHTQDGITIIFCGFINTSRSSQNGVSLGVCQHFLVGFPRDWNKYSPRSFSDSTAFSIDNMECECKNSEKGIPVESQVGVESQTNSQSFIGMDDCADPSGKNIYKTPTSAFKRKTIRQKIGLDANNSFSRMVTRSISKKYSHTMPKEEEKAPVDKEEEKAPVDKEEEKAPVDNIIYPTANVISPVRRSLRLRSCK